MATIYQNLESIKDSLDNTIGTVPKFGYKDGALTTDSGIAGHNSYDDGNLNNIPLVDGTKLTQQEAEKGFRDRLSTLSREMFTHFFGRASFNFNRLKSLLSDFIDTYKKDYARNFRDYDKHVTYNTGDVCFMVRQGVRYCFVAIDDNITDGYEITYNNNGTFEYDDSKWRLLQERRTVTHVVGEPFLWFGTDIPSGYICFSDGGQYEWNSTTYDFSELRKSNTFKKLVSFWSTFGAAYTATGFTVPKLDKRYHISKPVGDVVGAVTAVIPDHTHPISGVVSASQSTSSINHTHILNHGSTTHYHYAGWLNEGYDTFTGAYTGFVPENQILDYNSDYRYMDQDWDRTRFYNVVETTSTTNSVTMGTHTAKNVPSKSLSHSHTASGTTGVWSTPSDKYRPGTVTARLILRYK